jgi:hypothetical protein
LCALDLPNTFSWRGLSAKIQYASPPRPNQHDLHAIPHPPGLHYLWVIADLTSYREGESTAWCIRNTRGSQSVLLIWGIWKVS